jgi:DNA polymerase III subunit epsilon
MLSLRGRRPAAPHVRRTTPWADARYVALDFETTGLNYDTDHVISYGAVPVERGRVLAGRGQHQLVRPPTQPSPRSQTVHLLRPVDLAAAPSIRAVGPSFRAELDRRLILAWFADVEVAFLGRIFGGSSRWWRRRVIDVRDLAIAVDEAPAGAKVERGYGLSQTAERFGVPVASPHDALDDAFVTAQLFVVLAGKLPGRPRPTVGDLLALGS